VIKHTLVDIITPPHLPFGKRGGSPLSFAKRGLG
jgi:hypothetical protein